MKKLTLLIIAVLLAVPMALAGYRPGYYNQMDGKKKEELKRAAKQCVSEHQTLVYNQLPGYWQYTDVYPELVDGCKRWWDMYSDEICLIRQNQDAFSSFRGYGMQREHSVPKSWWKKNGSVEYTPAYSDLWNLYPSNGEANQKKSNYPFGPTSKPRYNNGVTKVGPPDAGYGGGASSVFEPADQYKGDFARAIFYMATVYDDLDWAINYMFRKENWPTLNTWSVSMLLQWARNDRVDQKEIDRNNLVEQYQGNRNPYIDFPELAEYVWGLRTDETFLISEQENIDPTPPITGDPEVTMPVNGEWLEFGDAAVDHSLTRVLQIEGANFTSSLSVRISGKNADSFIPEVTSIPASYINNHGGYLLNVTFQPRTTGDHVAKLILYDGGLEGSVVVNLSGNAEPVPVFETLTALPATEVKDHSYMANWQAPQSVADYYVLTRVVYDGDNQEAETYETGATSLLIEDRDPQKAESYTVSYSRLGMLSPASNSIYVAAGAGINSLNAGIPFRIFGEKGGIRICTADGSSLSDVAIYDVAGMLVALHPEVADKQMIPVAAGVYVVAAPGYAPRKVTVR